MGRAPHAPGKQEQRRLISCLTVTCHPERSEGPDRKCFTVGNVLSERAQRVEQLRISHCVIKKFSPPPEHRANNPTSDISTVPLSPPPNRLNISQSTVQT